MLTTREKRFFLGEITFNVEDNKFWKLEGEVLKYRDLIGEGVASKWHKSDIPVEDFLEKSRDIIFDNKLYFTIQAKLLSYDSLVASLQSNRRAEEINAIPFLPDRNKQIINFARKNTKYSFYCHSDNETIKFFNHAVVDITDLNLSQVLTLKLLDLAPYWDSYRVAQKQYDQKMKEISVLRRSL